MNTRLIRKNKLQQDLKLTETLECKKASLNSLQLGFKIKG